MQNLPSHIPIEPKTKKRYTHGVWMYLINIFAPYKIIVKEQTIVKRSGSFFSKKNSPLDHPHSGTMRTKVTSNQVLSAVSRHTPSRTTFNSLHSFQDDFNSLHPFQDDSNSRHPFQDDFNSRHPFQDDFNSLHPFQDDF